MVALAVVVGAAHSLSDVVAATVGAASRRGHHRLVAVQQLVTRQVSLLRLGLQEMREESMAAICFACDSEALSTGDDDAGTAPCSGCEMIAMEEVTLSASPMSLRQLTVATATAAVAGFFPSRRRRGLVPLG